MGLSTSKNARPGDSKPAAQAKEILYSLERLQMDEGERAHIRRELAVIKKQYGIKNCTVVEVGCGLGSNLKEFQADNRVIGVEGLEDAVAEARRQGLDVRQGNLDSGICVSTGSADWILCLDVLEHLVSPMKLMIEIRRVLRNGGRVVINVPNHFDLTGRIKLLMGHDLDVHDFFPERYEWDNPHLRFFTHRGIKQMVSTAGFEIVEDRSARFWSFPRGRILKRIGLEPVLRVLALGSPSAFARGLVLIARKNELESTPRAGD